MPYMKYITDNVICSLALDLWHGKKNGEKDKILMVTSMVESRQAKTIIPCVSCLGSCQPRDRWTRSALAPSSRLRPQWASRVSWIESSWMRARSSST